MTDPKRLNSSVYWNTKFIFWINSGLCNFLLIKESWKIITGPKQNEAVKLFPTSAYQNDFWRSCDTEDWSNDAENTVLFHRNKLYFKIY